MAARLGRIGIAMAWAALAGCTAAGPGPGPEAAPVSGRALFDQFCVACHGTAGRGDGPAASGLSRKPTDLTRIAARNGGIFPLVRVMSTIDGYTRKGDGSVMPELGAALAEGPVVMVDTGDSVETPTPANLVALAEYLRSIQQ